MDNAKQFVTIYVTISDYRSTEMCEYMGKQLHETAPAARKSEEAGFTQFLAHKFTLLISKMHLTLNAISPFRCSMQEVGGALNKLYL